MRCCTRKGSSVTGEHLVVPGVQRMDVDDDQVVERQLPLVEVWSCIDGVSSRLPKPQPSIVIVGAREDPVGIMISGREYVMMGTSKLKTGRKEFAIRLIMTVKAVTPRRLPQSDMLSAVDDVQEVVEHGIVSKCLHISDMGF